MKIILNSITFDPLVQKLWNDKHVHFLITSFPIIPKVEQGTPPLKRVMACDTSKQTNTFLNWVICKVTLSAPCLHRVFGPPFTAYPLWKVKTLLNLSMKYWNSAFNARGSRLSILVVQFGAAKIYVAASGGAEEKGKTGWNSVYHQNWWFSEFHPLLNADVLFLWFSEFNHPLNANVFFCRFFLDLTLCMTKLRVLVLCFPYFTDNCYVQVHVW